MSSRGRRRRLTVDGQFPSELHFFGLEESVFHSTAQHFVLVVHWRGISQDARRLVAIRRHLNLSIHQTRMSLIDFIESAAGAFAADYLPTACWTAAGRLPSTKKWGREDGPPKRCTRNRSPGRWKIPGRCRWLVSLRVAWLFVGAIEKRMERGVLD